MKTLLTVVPSATDSTSFYRAVGPLHELRRTFPELKVLDGSKFVWTTLKAADAVFMQRPFLPEHAKAASMAKLHGKPLWVDYDDDLFAVPESNPAFRTYSRKEVQNAITAVLNVADLVTVSTEALKRKLGAVLSALGRHPSIVHVLPNAYDARLYAWYRDLGHAEARPNKVGTWRGTNTHDADLQAFTRPMVEAFRDHLDWTLTFIGDPFWLTLDELGKIDGLKETNLLSVGMMDPIEFFHTLWSVSPAFMFVPLADSPFNHSKSNIAWIEAAHAGACALVPEWEEWKRPGAILYQDADGFREGMRMLFRGEVDYRRQADESMAYIMDTLTLDRVNLRREELLRELLETKV